MTGEQTENPSRQEMWVTCAPCEYTWIAAYLPMEAGKCCKLLLSTRCPKCGEKELLVAKESDIVAAIAAPA